MIEKGYSDFDDLERSVDVLEKEIPLSALAAIRALDRLKRVIRDMKIQHTDDGK